MFKGMISRNGRRLESQIPSISQLKFFPFPTRPLANVCAARCGNTIVAVSASGKIYTTQDLDMVNQLYYYGGKQGLVPYLNETLACCAKLGLLSPEAIEQNRRACESEELLSKQQYAAREITEASTLLGFTLTSEQQAIVDAINTTDED